MKKIVIFFLFLGSIIFVFYLFYREGTLPVKKSDTQSKIFVIKPGEGLDSIANNLEKEGLIRNKVVFYMVVKRLGIERTIQAGDFRLSPALNAYEVARTLTHGTLDTWLTIIEGMRKEEIAQIVSQNLGIPEVEFLKVAEEGRLFPDTYLIPKDATAEAVLSILTMNFNLRYNDELKQKARSKKLSDLEVITLASLVEKEARFDEDRQKVASILLKRYRNDWPLQVDATVQYILGYQPIEKRWWKEFLSEDDLKIDSAYNTYKNTGLPPDPIANPGLASIIAVVEADEDSPYWYYLSDKTGKMHYSRTLEEHSANTKRYLQ